MKFCSVAVFAGLVTGCLAVSGVVQPIFDLPHRGCYFTNWAQYRPGVGAYTTANVDPTLCTYISVAFANIASDALATLEWNDATTYAALAALKTNQPNLKIFLSVGGATLTSQLQTMAATESLRASFIATVVTNLRAWNLDGLDVDWEFPAAADIATYSTLLTELRAAFNAESAQTGRQRLALSAALHLLTDGGFNGTVIANTLDVANVMTYDLDGTWDMSGTGHEAPLFVGPQGTPSVLNVAAIMQTWVAAGVPKSMLAVGLPLYGRGWMLASPSSHGLDAPVTAAIPAGTYTQSAGSWSYYETCQNIQSAGATVVFDTNIQASYAYTSTWWIGYDNVQTITAKTQWAQTNGYGGVYVWDLAQDDFNNLCGGGKNPLLTAIKTTMAGGAPATAAPTQATTPAPTQKTTAPAATTAKPATTPKATTQKPISTTKAAPPASTTATSSGTAVCGTQLCQQKGPGLVSLGPCASSFCNCDPANNGYLTPCGGSLVYDPVNQYCNYPASVTGC